MQPRRTSSVVQGGATDPATMLGLVGRVEPTLHNPRGIAVTHRPRDVHEAGHICAPNLLAACSTCGRTEVLCYAGGADVDALKRGVWTCDDCAVST